MKNYITTIAVIIYIGVVCYIIIDIGTKTEPVTTTDIFKSPACTEDLCTLENR
jgi:hypothetical protein